MEGFGGEGSNKIVGFVATDGKMTNVGGFESLGEKWKLGDKSRFGRTTFGTIAQKFSLAESWSGRIETDGKISGLKDVDSRQKHGIETINGVDRLAAGGKRRNRMIGSVGNGVAINDDKSAHSLWLVNNYSLSALIY